MTSEKKEFKVPIEFGGKRVDSVIQSLLPEFSRTRIQKWIKEGYVKVDSLVIHQKKKIIGGEYIEIEIQPDEQSFQFEPEKIPIDIIFEDNYILVINKPADLVVHPAAGNWSGTLLNGILNHVPSNKNLPRAGIVHRLDKNTTGLMVVAKDEVSQQHLVRQLQSKKVNREYRAIVWGQVWKNKSINEPIGRHPTVRVKMAVNNINGKDSITHYEVLERFGLHSYLRCNLETGRTHQIRVHMQFNDSPIVGDPIYGLKKIIPTKNITDDLRKAALEFNRQALHAIGLGLIHPITNKPMKWVIDLPEDMKVLLDVIRNEVVPEKETFKFKNMYVDDPISDEPEEIDFDFEDDN
jgi:23S rRNA pseudouridine1911/1915/1917 synthase